MASRYARQTVLTEIGLEGQKKLMGSKVAVVGVGALGSVSAQLLARAGVGELCLIDRDVVELTNLQRQLLFDESDVGKAKVDVVGQKLRKINSSITIKALHKDLHGKNCHLFLGGYDLILDCTDNLETRFILNEYCRKEKKPWIYAAALKTSGYVMPIFPQGPCLSCFLGEVSMETCNNAGVLNTITTSIAALQTTRALQILVGKGIDSALEYYDVWHGVFKKIAVKQRKDCGACKGEYHYLGKEKKPLFVRFCSQGKYQINGPALDVDQYKKRWQETKEVHVKEDSVECGPITLFANGVALISAHDETHARALYSKYVGN